MGKTNPLNDKDLAEFVTLSKKKSESENSWSIRIVEIDQITLDLSVKNPNTVEEIDDRTPSQILEVIQRLDQESSVLLSKIRSLL
jgi:type I restriction enzyme M protein